MARNAVLNFGLVNIPVEVVSISTRETRSASFTTMHEDCGTPVKKPAYCSSCERLVPIQEQVKAMEIAKGKFLIFNDEELASLDQDGSPVIELFKFAPMETFPPFIEKVRWLAPREPTQATRSFWMLLEAMKATGTFGIGMSRLWGKEHPVGVFIDRNGMILTDVYPSQGWVEPKNEPVPITDEELALACVIIENLSGLPEPQDFVSAQRTALDGLVEAKIANAAWEAPEPLVAPEPVIDILSALKASVKETQKTRKKVAV